MAAKAVRIENNSIKKRVSLYKKEVFSFIFVFFSLHKKNLLEKGKNS
jgi:hypothetical protein